ncbi:hypothetical protein I2I11_05080 [Pontibacter sp. 172403-2]|uniref:hypothetical protein n=1 Tax=Pontibacter rufus TaxID=2791028 RepID=UPI0018AFF256|nr:hypothetical protein [Pontibacter sp. 172403-2]MBF9252657.1 hypothetical protein [Pontibacter sp. 172403-2]
MKIILPTGWPLLLLLAMAACSPKNEEVTDEQIEVGADGQALDTIANTKKDALKTDEKTISPTLPIAQPVLQLLEQRYPGWKQPELTAMAEQNAATGEQGPTLVHGDFNGDNRQDYALQLQQQRNLVIAAVLDAGDGSWELYELKQDKLLNEQDSLKSSYYLYLIDKGEIIENTSTAGGTAAPNDALGVGNAANHTAYLYQNGKFEPYSPAD